MEIPPLYGGVFDFPIKICYLLLTNVRKVFSLKEKIKQAAAALFAEHGYAGTSLAQISEKVGIKKPSIYAHYKSKKHLFESLLYDAFESEMARIEKTTDLYVLLESYLFLYEKDALFRFLLTSSFFPPESLKKSVLQRYYVYLDALELKAEKLLQNCPGNLQDAASMYTVILDSVFVELCYGTRERTEKRLETAWRFYWNSVMKG